MVWIFAKDAGGSLQRGRFHVVERGASSWTTCTPVPLTAHKAQIMRMEGNENELFFLSLFLAVDGLWVSVNRHVPHHGSSGGGSRWRNSSSFRHGTHHLFGHWSVGGGADLVCPLQEFWWSNLQHPLPLPSPAAVTGDKSKSMMQTTKSVWQNKGLRGDQLRCFLFQHPHGTLVYPLFLSSTH